MLPLKHGIQGFAGFTLLEEKPFGLAGPFSSGPEGKDAYIQY